MIDSIEKLVIHFAIIMSVVVGLVRFLFSGKYFKATSNNPE